MTREVRERRQYSELRSISAGSIEHFLRDHWNSIELSLLPPGQKEIIPQGWHGAGFAYDGMVNFKNLLTESMAGTELNATNFVSWLADKGFFFERGTKWLEPTHAAELLESEATPFLGTPIFRAWRRENVPIQIEFYHGATSDLMKRLSLLGNQGHLSVSDKQQYRQIVALLSSPFIAKGTTKVAQHMGLPEGYRRVARKDDCNATDTTFSGDKLLSLIVDRNNKVQEPLFWVDDVAVATTQAIVHAVVLSEMYNVPLLVRAGAASFGLGGHSDDLNYMKNTLPAMRRYGQFTAGDFGQNMQIPGSEGPKPARIHYGHGSPLRETRFFLSGGGPIMEMMFDSLKTRHKRHQGVLSVVQAKRVDHGPREWGVAIDGIHSIQEDQLYPRYRVEKGTILLTGKQLDSDALPIKVDFDAKLVSPNEDGFRVLNVLMDGVWRTLYEPIP